MSQINNYKLTVTSRLRNRIFTNYYEIAVSNMDQAKKKQMSISKIFKHNEE